MIKTLILVGLGGGIGSAFRFLISYFVHKIWNLHFPLGTFFVNIAGCLIVGLLIGIFDRNELINPNWRFLLISGFCGGFTTFSAFSAESFSMFESGNFFLGILYITASISIGLLAIWLGFSFVK